jgi:hypothetical protein
LPLFYRPFYTRLMGTVKGLHPLMWSIIIEAGDDFSQTPIAILGIEVYMSIQMSR